MMIQYKTYKNGISLSTEEEKQILNFLFTHLEQYRDTKLDIQQAIDYALQRDGKQGGILLTAKDVQHIIGAVVINKTGMKGYIPENILVYIATHSEYRGKGVGKKLIQLAIEQSEGNIALHVEPDNPAKVLYEKSGFTSKYLEMRLYK